MDIKFQSKEESNKQQVADFLKLKPVERVLHFYRLMERLKDFPTQKQASNNFEIVIHDESLGHKINEFIALANEYHVKMIMVGGGAVNFHGYQRHSADVDFWISTSTENLKNLVKVFNKMDYEIDDFPMEVKNQLQNISVKFSPLDLDLELRTKFSSTKSFEEAFANSEEAFIEGEKVLKWRVLSFDDLIDSKLKAQKPKDLLDIQQLQQIKKDN